ncbi:hypothetical protein E2I00_005390, partial [Balaenoptera physalus]
GDIGSVVDEHFSRALGQASTLHPESAISKSKMGLTPLWRAQLSQASGVVSRLPFGPALTSPHLHPVWGEFILTSRSLHPLAPLLPLTPAP